MVCCPHGRQTDVLFTSLRIDTTTKHIYRLDWSVVVKSGLALFYATKNRSLRVSAPRDVFSRAVLACMQMSVCLMLTSPACGADTH